MVHHFSPSVWADVHRFFLWNHRNYLKPIKKLRKPNVYFFGFFPGLTTVVYIEWHLLSFGKIGKCILPNACLPFLLSPIVLLTPAVMFFFPVCNARAMVPGRYVTCVSCFEFGNFYFCINQSVVLT